MNKTNLLIGALLGTMAFTATLSSCVKDDESASVTAVRSAKANLLNAQAAAEAVNAAANQSYQEAQAAYYQAQAAYYQAQAAYEQALADAKNIDNDEAKAVAETKIASLKAEYQAKQAQYEYDAAYYAQQLAELSRTEATAQRTFVNTVFSVYTNNLNKLQNYRSNLISEQGNLYNLQAELLTATAYRDMYVKQKEQEIAVMEKQLATYQEWYKQSDANVQQAYATAVVEVNKADSVMKAAEAAQEPLKVAYYKIQGLNGNTYTYNNVAYPGEFASTSLRKAVDKEYSYKVETPASWSCSSSKINLVSSYIKQSSKKYKDANGIESTEYNAEYYKYSLQSSLSLATLKNDLANLKTKHAAVIGKADDASTATVGFSYDASTGKTSYGSETLTLYARLKAAQEAVDAATTDAAKTAALQAQEVVKETIDKIMSNYDTDAKTFDTILGVLEDVANSSSTMQTEYQTVIDKAQAAYKAWDQAKTNYNEKKNAYDVAEAGLNAIVQLQYAGYNTAYTNNGATQPSTTTIQTIEQKIINLTDNINSYKKQIDQVKADISGNDQYGSKGKEKAIEYSNSEIAAYQAEIAELEKIVEQNKAELDALLTTTTTTEE